MKKLTMGLMACVVMGFAMPAFAQDEGEAEVDGEPACKQAAEAAARDAVKENGREILAAHGRMVQACAAFRSCKSTCRQDKRSCKGDARDEKRDCIADCDKKPRGAQAACKKECRQDKRADKRECRQDKRSCKTQCVATEKQGPCKDARKEFWSLVGKTTAKAAREINKACGPEFTQE